MEAPVSFVAWNAPAPEAAFARLRGRDGVFWLDSSLPSAAGRYSIMGCRPFFLFRARGRRCETLRRDDGAPAGSGTKLDADPLAELEDALSVYRVPHDANRPVPFCGGA